MHKSTLAKLLCALLVEAAVAQTAGAADLLQVYREAVSNDALIASARANLIAGQEKLPQGLSTLLPQVNLSASASRIDSSLNQIAPLSNISSTYNSRGYTLSLSQPLFRWGNWQQYEQGKLLVAQSEAIYAQAQLDLITRVSQAYFDVLAAEDSITYITANKAAISEQLASAKRNFQVGTSTITDTNEAQAGYDLAVAQELQARSNLDIARAALQQIIGKEAGSLTPLRPGVTLNSPEPAQIDPWVSSAITQSYAVAQSQASYEIAKRQIELNRAGHYPTLDLVASRSLNKGSASTSLIDSQTNTSVGLQLSIPIYSGGYTSSKVREAIALRDKAESDLENAKRTAAQNARVAYFGVTSGLAQVKAYEAAEISSRSSLESNKLGYKVGVRINIDVLNAEQQLYSTLQTLAKARYDTIMNGLKLKSAAGTLKEDDLQEINALLQH
jgi:outer membrane protein